MTKDHSDRVILDHYAEQAAQHRLEPSSTMADLTTRELELKTIVSCVEHAVRRHGETLRLLDVGCGNGYLLAELRARFPGLRLSGRDYSPDMVELAAGRALHECEIRQGDVRRLDVADGSVDVVVSERCIINILDEAEQLKAIEELHRVLAPGGIAVVIEAFTDGLDNLNRARTEIGLPPNVVPHHNRWFDKDRLLPTVKGLFDIVAGDDSGAIPPRNFLSTHYFISRVLYPAVTQAEILYNTEFVRFFRFLAPQGDFSPIQLYLLRKS